MGSVEKDLVIGFDIGTSSLKLIVLNIVNNTVQLELNKSTHESCVNSKNQDFNEQNVDIILNLVETILKQIPSDYFGRLRAIQLCGQMHGIVLWNTETKKHSNLVTWQDSRCTEEFLASLPVQSLNGLNSGFGCATLFWYTKNGHTSDLDQYNCAGTIHDYLTYLYLIKIHFSLAFYINIIHSFNKTFSLSSKNSMSSHNAYSWGYFDINSMRWQDTLLSHENFPTTLLPDVVEPGKSLSNKITILNGSNSYFSDIYVALGDLQCSVYSCLEYETDCVINISTSSQICMVINKITFQSIKSELPSSVTILPYFNNKILLAATSLNGGNVLEKFIDMLIQWNMDLGIIPEDISYSKEKRDGIWEKLKNAGENFCKQNSNKIVCKPLIFGERHDKQVFASISNMKHGHCSIGEIFSSVCRGIVRNLKEMMSEELLFKKLKCKRVIATGGTILRNNLLKMQLESEFNTVPVIYKVSIDAAKGAADFLKEIVSKKIDNSN